MKRILLSLLCMVSLSAYAQHTVVVNPDGTHSVVINNGNSATIVNPDGSHSTAILQHNGNSAIIVNPDGTHSTATHNGNDATIVNPDGTHSVFINNGNSASKDNPKWKKWWTRKSKNKKKGSSVNDQPAN